MRALPPLRTAGLALPLLLGLAACAQNPTEPPVWPIAVVPAAGQPTSLLPGAAALRETAVPPDCTVPETTPKLAGSSWHNPDLGMGCAQAHNLAVQIERPHDLLEGRAGLPDAEREAAAVQRYRKGEEKDVVRNGTRSSTGAGN